MPDCKTILILALIIGYIISGYYDIKAIIEYNSLLFRIMFSFVGITIILTIIVILLCTSLYELSQTCTNLT